MEPRHRAALLGLACGDALGATLEFMDRAGAQYRYPDGLRDIVGGGPWRLAAGETTDDTAMALCVLRGIRKAGADASIRDIVDAVGREFLDWAESGPKDIGNTCALAIDAFRTTRSWPAVRDRVRRQLGDMAAGNGALMRTLPISFFWPDDAARTVHVSRAITSMTHPHAEAEWCSAAYNLYVGCLATQDVQDTQAGQAVQAGHAAQAAPAPSEATAHRWRDQVALLRDIAPDLDAAAEKLGPRLDPARVRALPEEDVRSSGYCVDTLEAALWAFWTTPDLESCIVRAANLAGDADTVAAVAGGLAGAHYGSDALPPRWLSTVETGPLAEALVGGARPA